MKGISFSLYAMVLFMIASCCEQKPPRKISWSGTYEYDESGRHVNTNRKIRTGWRNCWELNLVNNKGVLEFHGVKSIRSFTLAVYLEQTEENRGIIKLDSVIWTGWLEPGFDSWKTGDVLATVSRKDTTLYVSSGIFTHTDSKKGKSETKLFHRVKTRPFGPFTNTEKHFELGNVVKHLNRGRGSTQGSAITSDIQLR